LLLVLASFHLANPTLSKDQSVATDTLYADAVFGGPPLLERPVSLRMNQNNQLLILDQWRGCVYLMDLDGQYQRQIGAEGQGPGQLHGPRDMAVDSTDRVFVADTGNDRLVVFDKDGALVRMIDVGYDVMTIDIMWDEKIYVQSNPNEGRHIIDIYTPEGERVGGIGELKTDSMKRDGVNRAFNRYYAAHNPFGSELIVARQAFPLVEIYDRNTGHMHSFGIRSSEMDTTRARYFYSLSEPFAKNAHAPQPNPSLQDYMADIENTIVDGGRPTIVQYIAGAELYGNQLYLLAGGNILALSLDGQMRRRYRLLGPSGETIYSHRLWISANGDVYTLDKAHRLEAYSFHIGAPSQPRGVEGDGMSNVIERR
jgi:hypothetical protein